MSNTNQNTNNAPGNSGNAPGRTGNTPGNSGNTPPGHEDNPGLGNAVKKISAVAMSVLVALGVGIGSYINAQTNTEYDPRIVITYSDKMTDSVLETTVYTIGGPGRGTLSENPQEVFRHDVNEELDTSLINENYDIIVLRWTEGSMLEGGDITITVDGDNVFDLAGNPLHPDSREFLLERAGLGKLPRILNIDVLK